MSDRIIWHDLPAVFNGIECTEPLTHMVEAAHPGITFYNYFKSLDDANAYFMNIVKQLPRGEGYASLYELKPMREIGRMRGQKE
jgi:hypothetical protein